MAMQESTTNFFEYLRVSVTDRCNLRCRYCMPEEGVSKLEHQKILRYEEILEIIRAATAEGVFRLRITGGEPLVRRGIEELVRQIHQFPEIRDLSLTTNGILLREFAKPLKEAGLDRINVSLDSLDAETYGKITRGGDLEKVLAGLDECHTVGLSPVKINVVLIPGVNDHEVEDFVRFAQQRGITVRFIEHMPFLAEHHAQTFISQDELLPRIQRLFALQPVSEKDSSGPALEYALVGTKAKIGFISSRSHPFCATCTRLRLTADGVLLPCLESRSGVAVRGKTQTQVRAIIRQLGQEKQSWHKSRATFCDMRGVSLSDIGG